MKSDCLVMVAVINYLFFYYANIFFLPLRKRNDSMAEACYFHQPVMYISPILSQLYS